MGLPFIQRDIKEMMGFVLSVSGASVSEADEQMVLAAFNRKEETEE